MILKYYNEPNARITITGTRKITFENVNRVRITESVKELGDSAVVVVPRNWKKLNGKNVLDYLSVGDQVKIELGYNGEYNTEFTGYLGEVVSDAPLKLMIDSELYPLRFNSWKKTWSNVKLAELLSYVAPDCTIECPDVELGSFSINDESTYDVLFKLKENYYLYSYIKDDVLHCHLKYTRGETTHQYTIGGNTKKGENNLKYHRKEDVKVKVKVISSQRNGTKLTSEVGSNDYNANQIIIKYPPNISQSQLDEYAKAIYNKYAFDGYSGTIKGWGYPLTHCGDNLKIVDTEEPERAGTYVIEKVVINYNLKSGYERINTLSFKV